MKLEEEASVNQTIKRPEFKYENKSQRFLPPDNNFTKQYFHVYLTRLRSAKHRLAEQIEKKWGKEYPVCRLGEISQQNGACIVIGTLFKDQQLKPSILKEVSEENQLIPQPHRTHFTDDSDVLFLEDEQQRIELFQVLNVHDLVTGIPCALLGTDLDLGQFKIEDYVFLDCAPQIPRPLLNDDRFIVFISGLDLANTEAPLLSIQLLVDWIVGMIGDTKTQEESSKICRVIIAGNSIRSCQDVKSKKSLISKNVETEDTFEAVKLLDDFLLQLVRYVDVDLLSGEFDPSNFMLPQQPLHYCMFPESNQFKTLHGVSNPYEAEIEGFRILGSSGQLVHEIGRYSRIEDPIECLEKSLEWSHLSPTAPDTLSCYPYYDNDPFLITECPHVLFAGNQPEFKTSLYKGSDNQQVQLICIPEFVKSSTVAVMNLNTFECYPLSFNVGFPE